jgi:predicted GIY-YIG superfamily endonuclease
MHVYVLELEERKYYVGIAKDVGLRLWEHFKMGSKTGSAWTKKFKPLRIIHLSEIFPKTQWKAEEVERQCVLRIAKTVGFSNVRGAGFSASKEDYPENWDAYLVNVPPANFDKMTPPNKKELEDLMKEKYQLWLSDRKRRRKPK